MPRAFAEGVGLDEMLELPDELGVAPQGQVGLDPPFEGQKTKLFEPSLLALEEVGSDIDQGRTSPQGQGLAQPHRDLGRVAGRRADQPLELCEVDFVGPGPKDVAPGGRGEVLSGTGHRQLLAQLRDVDLQGVGGGGRWVVPPEGIDQPVGGHGLVGPEHQGGEQDPLATAGERHGLAVVPEHLEWTQEPVAHP